MCTQNRLVSSPFNVNCDDKTYTTLYALTVLLLYLKYTQICTTYLHLLWKTCDAQHGAVALQKLPVHLLYYVPLTTVSKNDANLLVCILA